MRVTIALDLREGLQRGNSCVSWDGMLRLRSPVARALNTWGFLDTNDTLTAFPGYDCSLVHLFNHQSYFFLIAQDGLLCYPKYLWRAHLSASWRDMHRGVGA